MFETLGLDLTPREASVWYALALGLAFGVLAQVTRFCLRRAVVASEDQASARGVWAMALAVAVLGTQGAVALGWIGFEGHRFMTGELPVLAIVLGGLMFGAGAVLTRGCISRLTVLTGTGNMRALVGVLVFAAFAHMTIEGVLMPLRTGLGSVTVSLGAASSLAAWPGGAWVWAAALAVLALAVAWRSGAGPWLLLGAALIGALVPVGWVGTGFVLFDDFDPIALEGMSFTLPWADTLFWGVASSLTAPGFGVGLIGGVLAGALVAAVATGRFQWQGFDSAGQTGRSLSGAALMGVGGVLAGGCTVGAGLSGVPTLSVAAVLALASIIAGLWAADALQTRLAQGRRGVSGAYPAE